MKTNSNIRFLLCITIAVALSACATAVKTDNEQPSAIELRHADNLRLTLREGGWIEAELTNPWDTSTTLQRIALVPRQLRTASLQLPGSIPVVKIPLEKALVTTTIHAQLIDDFGKSDAIAGVTDVDYIRDTELKERIDKGEIANCGSWMAPDIEKVISLNPDAILISPYQNGGNYAHLTQLNIPIVYMADYMESTPLGRAEWMKYYGLLFGAQETADSIFSHVEREYSQLQHKADSASTTDGRPTILIDRPYMGTWYVHGVNSANDNFITDAGARNPFNNLVEGSSQALDPETVLYEAGGADIWIIRYHSPTALTKVQMETDDPMSAQFKSFKQNRLWGANTAQVSYYEETPFHPELLLRDLVTIVHPGITADSTLRYFTPVE